MPKHKQAGQTTVLTKMTANIDRKRLQCRSHPQKTLAAGAQMHLYLTSAVRDKTDLGFSIFATAALLLICDGFYDAVQFKSRKQPFLNDFVGLTQAVLSPYPLMLELLKRIAGICSGLHTDRTGNSGRILPS